MDLRHLRNYLVFIVALLAILGLPSCKIGRFIWYNFADIGDYKIFPVRDLESDGPKFEFHATDSGKFPRNIALNDKETTFEEFLKEQKTVAFLIIKNDTIQYEKYFEGYDHASIVPSFSMAKSVTSILVGCAIDDGLIRSVQDTVTQYVPELKQNGFDKVTIAHLLQMTSGLDFDEGYYSPFSEAASFYYGRNLRKSINKLKLKREPGEAFEYVSGNPQILGLILERVLKDKTVTQYLQEKLWSPMGMEYDASWSLDRKKNGLEKTFCCLNARARDFAKIGRLYLHKGNWNGKQIVPEDWVRQSTKVDSTEGSAWHYQYQWWLPTKDGDFMAQGILGQYIYVNPSKNLIIVRLGKKRGEANWRKIFPSLASAY